MPSPIHHGRPLDAARQYCVRHHSVLRGCPRPPSSADGGINPSVLPRGHKFAPTALRILADVTGYLVVGREKGDDAHSGRGRGTRTPGLRFWRPSLYQLSYTPPRRSGNQISGRLRRKQPFRSTVVGDGAGEGNRTLVISLEGCCSTIELHPHRGREPDTSLVAASLVLVAAPDGGGGRTRTYEGVRQRIYSPPPLPLGTLPHPDPGLSTRRNGRSRVTDGVPAAACYGDHAMACQRRPRRACEGGCTSADGQLRRARLAPISGTK